MKKLIFLFAILFLMAEVLAVPQTTVHYFYSITCPHCANVAQSGVLENASKILNVTVEKYELSVSERNQGLYLDYAKKVGVNDGKIPFLVIEQNGSYSYLEGDVDIINNLTNSITNFSPVNSGNGAGVNLSLWIVIITALIDSINPCAFGVLLFLLAVLLSMGSSKRALKYGIIYSIVIFIAYFLAGLGIIKLFNSISFVNEIKFGLGIIVLIGALIELKDVFWEGRGISLKIPVSTRPLLEKYVRHGTLSAIIILGVLVALVELPCTGLMYVSILSLISKSGTIGTIYLLIYNFIFILPLLIITLGVYHGSKTDKINNWVQNNKKYMRLAAGIIMIILALSLFNIIKIF